ncbi:MAG: IS30 family transposase [Candidatus Moranbacteria bacterium]|nr:IS30 family transposase [Candidatus Moranbacteria bacterium]
MYKHFSIEEREKIQELLWQKTSVREIAKTLNRSPSSVSREIKRYITKEKHHYTPRVAHEQALKHRRSRGRPDRLKNERIREYVILHLKLHWSPEQIAGRMKQDIHETISHEAIYQYVYAQIHRDGYGYLKPGREDLRVYLRWKRRRRQRKGLRKAQRMPKFEGISIDARPKVVEERKRLGDWEGDTVESRDHKPGVNTLVERKSGYVFMTKLKSKSSESTLQAVLSRISALPEKLRKTLTLDNGPENSKWRTLKAAAGMDKKTDFSMITNEEIAFAEYDLNTRPRKRLNWKTPLEILSVALEG